MALDLGHARRVQPRGGIIAVMSVEGGGGGSEYGVRPGVLVVGAGPTGLALASQLDALGATVRIVDRQLDRVHESRALVVLPRTLELLRGVGVSEKLVERGNDAMQLQVHFGRKLVRIRLFDVGLDDTAFPFLLFVSQAETEAVLNEHLVARGVDVERGVELVTLAAEEQQVACTLRHQDGTTEQLRVGYLVGCDGARSSVRRLTGIPFEGGSYPQTFALADLEVDALERDTAHAFIAAPGMLFFFPLGQPASWRMGGMRPTLPGFTEGEEAPEPSLADLQAIADAFTGGTLRLRDPVWRTYFRLHHRHAVRYRAGRVFLAGDAAHVHSPAGAQGMNTGIQDAWNLGWKLALVDRGVADAALLDSYQPERWPIGRFVLRFTDRATAIASADTPVVRLIRTQIAPRLAPIVLPLSRPRAFGFRTLSQLRINYRPSPAVAEGSPAPRGGPRAGDRLPDARIVERERGRWLQEALATPAYHLLLCGPAEGWDDDQLARLSERYAGLVAVDRLAREPAAGVLHDVRGEAFVRLGVEQAAHYLVRPDGYIGYRGGGTDLDGLERYLARWLRGRGAGTPG
jgi:2-polyprenyl-6-methoxyphenol hydroxylase-like FAD-dependent oxidoreductase